MEEKDQLETFSDLIEPPPVPFSFDAIGWYVLAGILLIAAGAVIFILVKHHRKNRYRRTAIAYLSKLEQTSLQVYTYEVAILIKRIAIARYGRNIAGLSGSKWIQWLNTTSGKHLSALFDEHDKKLITEDIYAGQTPSAEQVNIFARKAREWIKYHHAI